MKKLEKMKWKSLSLLILMVFMFIGSSLYAQVDKMKQAIEDENPKRVLKIFDNSVEDSKLRKNPEIYFLKAKALLILMEDEFYLKKNPESFKDGMKLLKKGKGYDKDDEVIYDYEDVIDSYVKVNNGIAKDLYGINKYGKALRTYGQSYNLNQSLEAYYMQGKCALMSEDTALAESYYNNLIVKYDDEVRAGNETKDFNIDPYLYFVDKYWNKERFDSANFYLESARKIFGSEERLDYFQMEVAKAQIKSLPPSTLMMEVIQRNLGYFKRDTFLIHKENALYLYMIRNAVSKNHYIKADTLMDRMARSKIARSKTDLAKDYKLYDAFYDTKFDNVTWKVASYFYKYNHPAAGGYSANKYIEATAKDSTDEALQDRWSVIIDFAAKKKSLYFGHQLLELAKRKFPKNTSFADLELSLINAFKGKDLDTKDRGALRAMMNNTGNVDADYNNNTASYIDQLIKEQQYTKAKTVILKEKLREPESKIWDRKFVYMVKEDFFNNYYQTRIKEETVAGMKVNGFEWNGKTYDCNEGTLDPKIQDKVERRINYFRRNAGLEEIYLDEELNGWCQKAALVFETNKKLNHDLSPKWSCYTDEAGTAAKYSLLTEGANTTLAVTSFFADNRNPSVGNRRWLLYPNGKAFGHGSTTNYSVIWALDDSGNVDTNEFKDRFVAWPPEGFVPKMMAFRYWSFSLSQDLKGATVELTENGEVIPVKLQSPVEGYGMNTLVWEPQTSFKEMNADRKIHVVIKLTNGRIYEYDTTILDFEAKGY